MSEIGYAFIDGDPSKESVLKDAEDLFDDRRRNSF